MRPLVLFSFLFFSIVTSAVNAANTWPERPITIVIPGAPGTAADLLGRKVAEGLSQDFRQPTVVENKPGGGGVVAYNHVKRQKPDGHTLMIAIGGMSIISIMHKHSGIDPLEDFTPLTQLALTPMIIVANKESPWEDLADLVQSAKKQPGKFMYGSFGIGSTSHLVGESLKNAAGIDIEHIPYKSGMEAAPDVIAERLDLAIIDPLAAVPMVKDGRLKALGVAGPTRMNSLPDVATVKESGYDFSAVGWVGLFGPSNLPDNIATKINNSANNIMAMPEQLDLLANSGSQPVKPALSLEEWKVKFSEYVDDWTEVAEKAGMGDNE